jgi:hypothetical protein
MIVVEPYTVYGLIVPQGTYLFQPHTDYRKQECGAMQIISESYRYDERKNSYIGRGTFGTLKNGLFIPVKAGRQVVLKHWYSLMLHVIESENKDLLNLLIHPVAGELFPFLVRNNYPTKFDLNELPETVSKVFGKSISG